MIRKLLFAAFTILITLQIQGQTCASNSRNPWEWPGQNNWLITTNLFTGTVLNFSAGSQTAYGDAFNPVQAYEGVSGASDDQGNLIFLTNGRQVFNPAGVATFAGLLEGNEGGATGVRGSASQGVITVRHPLNPNRYFVFTVDDALSPTSGLNYGVFDETGAVVSGVQRLGGFRTTEGITATWHQNEVDIWIVVQESGSTNLHAFLLRCDGTITGPVTSSGVVADCTGNEERGGLAFSWDSRRIASGHPASWPDERLYIVDFDNATGQFSNSVGGSPLINEYFPYDITFSPDNSRVLASNHLGRVFSTSLAVMTEAGLEANTTAVSGAGNGHSAIEIGGDGVLYRSSLGAPNLVRLTGNLNGGGNLTQVATGVTTSSRGLPTMFIPPAEEPIITPVGPFCNTDAPVNLQTVWMCSGLNAEDTVNAPASEYTGPGILYSGEGIFDPATAGPGVHRIIFTKCAVDDTIFITVNDCGGCTDSLKNITPEICAGNTVLLDTFLVETSASGVWTVAEAPAGAGTAGSIAINGGDTLFDASSLTTTPGRYKLMYTVTDGANTCKDSIYIIVNTHPVVAVNNDTICSGAAAVTFTATADSTISTYLWSDNGTGAAQTTTGNTAGNYTVEVTDNNGCKDTATGVLRVNALPVVTVNNDTICVGDPNATFTATVDSAVALYAWSDNGSGALQTTSGNTAGNYTVTITDVNGCQGTATGTLRVNALPVVTVNSDTICAGDPAAVFTATADSAVSIYAWSDNGSGALQTTSGTTAGNYTVNITDVNGCQGTATGTLRVNALPVVAVNNDTICVGDPDAIFTATVDSTVALYAWSGNGSGAAQTTSGSTAGNYIVNVTDVNGCQGTATGTLKVNALPVVTVNNDTICTGDPAATFTATVDSAVAVYAWSGNANGAAQTAAGTLAGNYTVAVTDVNGCQGSATGVLTVSALPVVTVNDETICAGDPAATFTATVDSAVATYLWSENGTGAAQTTSGAVAGNYTVSIVDVNGCAGTATGVLSVNALPQVTVNNDTICEGGTAALFTATSDSAAASYAWSDNGTGNTSTTNGTVAGIYTVTVVDQNGCQGTGSGTLKVNTPPVVTVNNDTICAGGAAAVFTATSDSTAATYTWSGNGNGANQTTSGTTAGDYVVTVIDVNGCEGTGTGTLKVNALPVVNVDDQTICQGDPAAQFTANSDSTAVLYAWYGNGAGATQTIQGSTAGTYNVEVTDENGCVGLGSATLTVNRLPVITVADQAICAGAAAATFTANSDSTASTYAWSDNGTGSNQTTNGTTAGNYTVTVTDVNGCVGTQTATLTVNTNPVPNIPDATICPGMSQTLDATPTGGIAPFDYVWSHGAMKTASVSVTPAAQTTYSVTITDANGCLGTDDVTITIQQNLTVLIGGMPRIDLCEGEDTILMSNYRTVDGYNFQWSNGSNATTESITVNTSGTYALHVDNGLGCEGDTTIEVVVNPLPQPGNQPDSICAGESTNIGENMGAGYTYVWENNSALTNYQLAVTAGGTYTRVVTSAAGCVNSSSYVVTQFTNPTVNLGPPRTECQGTVVTLSEQSGSNRISYSWNTGANTATITPTTSGTYSLDVVDQNGCPGSGSVTVEFLPIPVVQLPQDQTICEGESVTIDAANPGMVSWNTNTNDSEITISAEGTYIATASNGLCSASDTFVLAVIDYPTSLLDPRLADNPYCFAELDSPVVLVAGTNEQFSYLWDSGETTSSLQVTEEGSHSVQISVGSCMIEDQITLKDWCPYTLYVPNAFTPNGDGLNDVFYAYGTNLQEFQLIILDRWGLKIYETTDLHEGWDGTYRGRDAQLDVYVWKVLYTVETLEGNMKNNEMIGTVTLVR